ncbi:MAG: HEPN domain-containing protein [Candidatus Magasanikbacteria bacterium]|nr:HEPN domain-containing protein [Candidatus Magasanikbacteria bacterium]
MEAKLTQAQFNKLTRYWIESTEENYKTMLSLYHSRRYDACLFFGHLILEKTLKIFIMKHSGKMAPRIHDLVRLVKATDIEITQDDLLFLSEVNDFQMEGRYPETKYQFYKKCTKNFTQPQYERIQKIYHLWQKLM